MLRLIRRIHSLPPGVNETVDPARRQLSAVLEDADALLDAVARLPNEEVTLVATQARPARDAVKSALQAAGLGVREHHERFVAELDGRDDQVRRREHLALLGIDATRMVERPNAGGSRFTGHDRGAASARRRRSGPRRSSSTLCLLARCSAPSSRTATHRFSITAYARSRRNRVSS